MADALGLAAWRPDDRADPPGALPGLIAEIEGQGIGVEEVEVGGHPGWTMADGDQLFVVWEVGDRRVVVTSLVEDLDQLIALAQQVDPSDLGPVGGHDRVLVDQPLSGADLATGAGSWTIAHVAGDSQLVMISTRPTLDGVPAFGRWSAGGPVESALGLTDGWSDQLEVDGTVVDTLLWEEGDHIVTLVAAAPGGSTVDLVWLREDVVGLDRAEVERRAADAPPPPGVLGIRGEDDPGGGAVVVEVVAGSGAADAGVVPGDVITWVDGRPIADWAGVGDALEDRVAGESVELVLRRGPDPTTVEVVLRSREELGP